MMMRMISPSLQTSSEVHYKPRAGAGAGASARAPAAATAAAQPSSSTSTSSNSARFRRWRQHCSTWRPSGSYSRGSSAGWQAPLPMPTLDFRPSSVVAAASSAGAGEGGQPETLADVMGNIWAQLLEMQQQQAGAGQRPTGAHLHVEQLGYQPPGEERGSG